MRNVERGISIAVVVALLLALAGCNGEEDSAPDQTRPRGPGSAASGDGPSADAPSRPPVADPDDAEGTLAVVTLNMRFAHSASAETIAGALARHRPDVVFLQEARPAQAAAVAKELGMQQVGWGEGERASDAVVLARQGAVVEGVRTLSAGGRAFAHVARGRFGQGRLMLCSVHQTSTHPGMPGRMIDTWRQRVAQTNALLDWLNGLPPDTPVIFGGDFNEEIGRAHV